MICNRVPDNDELGNDEVDENLYNRVPDGADLIDYGNGNGSGNNEDGNDE